MARKHISIHFGVSQIARNTNKYAACSHIVHDAA
jgi:hypothetical protein